MKTNKHVLTALLLALCGIQQSTHGWAAGLKAMRHPNGHVVRLMYDIHAVAVCSSIGEKKALAQEKKFLLNIEEALQDFFGMDPKEYEMFVVEKTAHDLSLSDVEVKQIVSRKGIGIIPLLGRLVLLVHPSSSLEMKHMVSKIKKCALESRIELVAYDKRSLYPEILKHHHAAKRSQKEILADYVKMLIKHQEIFAQEIKKSLDLKFGSVFKEYMKTKAYTLIQSLYKSIQKPGTLDLNEFYMSSLCDFGYLEFIGQHAYKNCTLYLGGAHCHNLAQDLGKMGYETIFEAGTCNKEEMQKNPGPLSKKEYQEFFAAGRMKF